jgi:acetyl-CoA carboxylase biotin carboxylase subunit
MNTRLQVEHPITEAVSGVDLVQWQIRIARGERLTLDPASLMTPRGHAVECRIYAEDADAGFMPSPGRIVSLRVPAGPGIRDDSGADAGGEVPIFYDPMISKLVAWGADRSEAVTRMRRALREYEVIGIKTTVPFFRWLLAQPAFIAGAFHTGYLDELLQQRHGEPFTVPDPSLIEAAVIAAALFAAERGGGAPDRPADAPGRLGDDGTSAAPAASGWQQQSRREGVRG